MEFASLMLALACCAGEADVVFLRLLWCSRSLLPFSVLCRGYAADGVLVDTEEEILTFSDIDEFVVVGIMPGGFACVP